MDAPESLPFWLHPPWRRLYQARALGRMPHALLLSGGRGMGKEMLARHLGQSLLCQAPDGEGHPCGRCRGCHLFRAGTHPDFVWLAPDTEGGSREIRIDAVREACMGEALSSQAGGYRILVFAPAEAMNRHAFNALLKTLEEPLGDTLMLLLAVRAERLPATIRSRCQRLHLAPPTEDAALAWLAAQGLEVDAVEALRLAAGAPLAALEVARDGSLQARREALGDFLELAAGRADPVLVAEAWTRRQPGLSLNWIAGWIADLARAAAARQPPRLRDPRVVESLMALATRLDPAGLHRLWRRVVRLAAEAEARNLSPQLALETSLVEWARLCHRAGPG